MKIIFWQKMDLIPLENFLNGFTRFTKSALPPHKSPEIRKTFTYVMYDVGEHSKPLFKKSRTKCNKCSICSESNSSSSSSGSSASESQSSATQSRRESVCVSQGAREESVDRIVISNNITQETVRSADNTDIVDTFLQSLQDTQESQVILNIGVMKFEISKVTLGADPTSVFSLIQNPNSPFRPCNNIYFCRSGSFILQNYARVFKK